MFMSMGHAVTRWSLVSAAPKSRDGGTFTGYHVGVLGLLPRVFMASAAAESHVDVCVCSDTRDHVDVRSPCCHQKPMCKSMIHTPADCKGQGNFFCIGFNVCRLTVEEEGLRRFL